MRGESDAEHPRDETDNATDNLSGEEALDVIAKLNHLRHQYFVPRMLQSVMDQVFYVLESTRHNLKYESRRPEWSASAAFEMYQFYTALEEAVESAREIERSTGFSGAEIAACLDEE